METKQNQTFFHGMKHIQICDIILHWYQNTKNISVTFMIGIFKFHCKSEQKKVK